MKQKLKKPRDEKSALLTYVSILFAAAFILVLASYLLAQRNSSERITELSEFGAAYQTEIDAKNEETKRLEQENAELLARINELEEELADEMSQKASALTVLRELDEALTQKDVTLLSEINAASKLRGRISELESELDAAKKEQETLNTIYTLIYRASSYFDQGRYDECREVYDQLLEFGADGYLSTGGGDELSPGAIYRKLADYFS